MALDPWWFAYPPLGAVIGFFAGLLGIGGGMMAVTILALLFDTQGVAREHVMHLALGTGFATILFTSLSSVRAHHRHGAVRWDVVARMAPGMVVGTFGGSALASLIATRYLAWIVVVFVSYTAVQMFRAARPRPARELPGAAVLAAVGLAIGVVCGLVAAGGGFLTIPFMVWCNIRMHEAIGTSAALGFPIALAGTLGYLAAGLGKTGLPAVALGYIHLPALAGIVVASVVTAPFGARVAHRSAVSTLKRVFGVTMLLLALRMGTALV